MKKFFIIWKKYIINSLNSFSKIFNDFIQFFTSESFTFFRCESLDFIKPGQDANCGGDGGGRVGGGGDQFKRRSAIIEHSQPQSLPVISSSTSRHPSPSLPPLPSLPTVPALPPPQPQVRKKSYLSRFANLPFIKGFRKLFFSFFKVVYLIWYFTKQNKNIQMKLTLFPISMLINKC